MNPSILFAISALRNLRRDLRRTRAVLATVACGTGIPYVYHGFNSGMVLEIHPAKLFETCTAPLAATLLAAVLAGLRVARMPIAEALRAS
jgi:hypothetical protein